MNIYELATSMKAAMSEPEWSNTSADYLEHRLITDDVEVLNGVMCVYTLPAHGDKLKIDYSTTETAKQSLKDYFEQIDGYNGLFKNEAVQNMFVTVYEENENVEVLWHMPATKGLMQLLEVLK